MCYSKRRKKKKKGEEKRFHWTLPDVIPSVTSLLTPGSAAAVTTLVVAWLHGILVGSKAPKGVVTPGTPRLAQHHETLSHLHHSPQTPMDCCHRDGHLPWPAAQTGHCFCRTSLKCLCC